MGAMTKTAVAPGHDLQNLRRLLALMTGDEKHGPAATSTLDALWVLYDRIRRVSPAAVDAPGRDRFQLSKGHGPMAYYPVLAAKGFVPEEWLTRFGSYDSPRGHHPDRLLVPGAEIGSGVARTRAAAGRGHRARAAGAGADRNPGVGADRGRRAGRGDFDHGHHARPLHLDDIATVGRGSAAGSRTGRDQQGRLRPGGAPAPGPGDQRGADIPHRVLGLDAGGLRERITGFLGGTSSPSGD